MTRNMGTRDRALRAFLVAPAAAVAAILVGAGSVLGVVLLVVAALMVATAAAGYCPLYALVGLSTRRPAGRMRSA
jgi:Protein of unknown function (DUF2892)